MKKTIFLILCILCSLGAMAQKKSITGVVTDASGESVIGASVVEVVLLLESVPQEFP